MATVKPASTSNAGKWRGFSLSGDNSVKSEFPDRITTESAWDGKELEAQPERWIYRLTQEDIQDVDQALKHFLKLDLPLTEISTENFPLKTLNQVLVKERENLFNGLGFGLLRGLPILDYDRKEQIAIFMGIGAYIGIPKPQNSKGHVLGHVKDLSHGSATKSLYDAEDPITRIYATRKAQPFHVDGADVVALLCLNKGVEGGLSSLMSSHTLYNRLMEERPDIVELMKQPWLWDRKGEHAADEPEYITAPPLMHFKDKLFTFWAPHFFETMTRFPGIHVEEEKFEAMKYIQELCEREALNMSLEVGDIQFVQNYQILHARTAYSDRPDQARHLLRLWFIVNAKEVGWQMPFADCDFNYIFEYADKFTIPLEAE